MTERRVSLHLSESIGDSEALPEPMQIDRTQVTPAERQGRLGILLPIAH